MRHHHKKNKFVPERLFAIPIDVVFRYIDDNPEAIRMDYNGYNFSIKRSVIHKQIGLVCVTCGLESYAYYLEVWKGGTLHLDLYSKLEDGTDRLMTIDHTFPHSKGGPNKIYNYQMMCTTCNTTKGNKIATEILEPMEV